MVEKKLLVNDKITACVKQICLLGVIYKNSNRKMLSGEAFCFLERLLSIFRFLSGTYQCFQRAANLSTTTFLECIVIFL